MAGAGVSGQFGKILADGSTLVECTGWTWNRSVADHSYASCATAGHKKHVAGSKDSDGELRGVLSATTPIETFIEPGDSVTLKLYYTATKFHQVPAVILSLNEEVDIDDGEIVRWTANFAQTDAPTLNQTDP